MISVMNSNDIDLDRKPRGSEEKDVVFDSSNEETRVWHGDDVNSSGSNEVRVSKDEGSIKGEKVSILDGNVESGDRKVEEMRSADVDVDLKGIDEKIKKDDQFSDENGGTERLESGARSWEDTEANPGDVKSQVSVRNGKNDKLVSRAKKGHVKGEKSSVSQYDSMLSMFDEFAANGRGGVLEEKPPGYGYEIGDMVWGKVKSHPWWPGHIYSEKFASPSVRRSKTEGHVLVAFFGDSSYGWFDPAELVPFDSSFSEKSRQTSSRTFVKAVEEAVDEANRRRALGLACRCRNPYNFRVTNVRGYFAVDVGDYEPGTIYSVDQIRKARESFQPGEILAFIKQLALSPTSNEHGSIHFMKDKATVLAYRKAVYEEFDETYAQAFGHQPVRPSRQTLDMVPIRAPLSGPLVIAEALGKAKGSARPNKSKDQAKKDRYLFKRRDEPNELKTSIQINPGQATSSGQSVYVDGSLAIASGDYMLQKRSPLVSTNHEVPEKHERTERLAGDIVSDLSHQGTGKEGMTISEKPAVVEFSMGEAPGQFSHSLEARSSLGKGKDVGHIGRNASDSVGDMPCTIEPSGVPIDLKDDASSTAFKSAESFEQSFSQAAEIELHGEQVRDGFAASHPLGMANAKVHGEGPKVHTDIATKKAKIRKHPAGELNSENSIPSVKKKKQKKELVSSQNTQICTSGDKARSSVGNIPGISVHVSVAAREDFQVDCLKKGDTVRTSSSAVSIVAQKMAQMEELELPQLLHDLQVLALDPSHNAERSTAAVTQEVFLRFRSLVYQKSLASLPPADSESNESHASKHLAVAAANNLSAESIRELPSFKPQRPVVRSDDPTKGGRKRGPSDRQEEIAAKKKKKINDMKVLTADKKAAQKISALPRGDVKETSGPTIKSVKQEPLKKPEPPSKAPEPTMLVMKFPPQGTLPSIMELKARFARFGQMDHSATRIFWKSSTCRVVYRHKADAQSAYRFTVGSSNLFGNTGVRCFLRELGVAAPETEPGKSQREGSSMGTSQARDSAVERRPAAPLWPQAQQQPGIQLKSILKKSTGDETSGNGGGRGIPRVKFILGEEENSRGGEELMIGNKNFNNNASFADGGASSSSTTTTTHHGMDFNSKNIVIPPSPSPLLPSLTPAVQFPRPTNNLHYAEIVPPRNAHNFNILAAPSMTHSSAHNVDISQQMMSLLTKCNDVVTNLTAYLGYVPYHPL